MPNTDACSGRRSITHRHALANQDRRSSLGIIGGEIQSILQLLRTSVSGDLSWLPSIQQDWRTFAAACDFHHLAPFVFCRVRDLVGDSVPAGLLEHLRTQFYEISANNYRLAKKLVDLTSLLRSHGVPVLA